MFFFDYFSLFYSQQRPQTTQTRRLGRFVGSASTTANESRRLVGGSLSFHLPFHHHQRPTFTHYHVPATSHLTTHTSHHHHHPVTSPHPTATTRHVTSPTFSNRAGKKLKLKKRVAQLPFFCFSCVFPPPLPVSSPPNPRTCVRLTFFFFLSRFHERAYEQSYVRSAHYHVL